VLTKFWRWLFPAKAKGKIEAQAPKLRLVVTGRVTNPGDPDWIPSPKFVPPPDFKMPPGWQWDPEMGWRRVVERMNSHGS
jgi:hypothetical protein